MQRRDFVQDIELVRSISAKLDKKLAKSVPAQDRLDRLTAEELLDLNKLVGLAGFLLCKHEEKKHTKEILEEFVLIVNSACRSIDGLDDEIAELLVEAEDSINKIRCLHANMSDKSDVARLSGPGRKAQVGANNLTNTAIEINPLEYLRASQHDSR